MLDRERILAKLDELASYLDELNDIAPSSFEAFRQTEKKRACERLLQIAIEAVIDVSGLIVSGLRLGLPADEDDVFRKLLDHDIFSEDLIQTLRSMRGFRNILVHEYGGVDDQITFEMLRTRRTDFERFQAEVRALLRQQQNADESS